MMQCWRLRTVKLQDIFRAMSTGLILTDKPDEFKRNLRSAVLPGQINTLMISILVKLGKSLDAVRSDFSVFCEDGGSS